MVLVEVVKSIRPQHWIKNFFVFAALIFSQNILVFSLVIKTTAAFTVFCLITGALYIFNDLKDIEEDRHHPIKSQRPLAAGRLKASQAWIASGLLIFLGLTLALFLGWPFLVAVLLYCVLQVAYSTVLKHVVILDVFIIALGFLIRVVAGALPIDVEVSPWLLICMLLLALFLAMSKRRHELELLDNNAVNHRPILREYSRNFLDQMIAVVTASTVIAYCLYTISEETIAKFGTNRLIYTVPFVIYGIFRYLYLVHRKAKGGSPEVLILRDKPLLFDLFLWIGTACLILYL